MCFQELLNLVSSRGATKDSHGFLFGVLPKSVKDRPRVYSDGGSTDTLITSWVGDP